MFGRREVRMKPLEKIIQILSGNTDMWKSIWKDPEDFLNDSDLENYLRDTSVNWKEAFAKEAEAEDAHKYEDVYDYLTQINWSSPSGEDPYNILWVLGIFLQAKGIEYSKIEIIRNIVEPEIGTKDYYNSREPRYYRTYHYQHAMSYLVFEAFSEDDMQFFKELYLATKNIYTRNTILKAFVLQCTQYDLKDFFFNAYKKERDLGLRLISIRGYAAYATEEEVSELVKKFNKLIINWCDVGTYRLFDYKIYNVLLSKFGLPYLVEHYGYDCFRESMRLVEERYHDYPDELKGYYMIDENGYSVQLMSNEEFGKRLDSFLEDNSR
jgi:hypothetical protein